MAQKARGAVGPHCVRSNGRDVYKRQELGIGLRPDYEESAGRDYSFSTGVEAAGRLLDRAERPTALFCVCLLYTSSISGAKNAAVAILPATILAADKCIIENLPDISDVAVSLQILSALGAQIRMLTKNSYEIDTSHILSLIHIYRKGFYPC